MTIGSKDPRDPRDTGERASAALTGLEHLWLVPRDGMPAIEVDRSDLLRTLTALRDQAGFESVTFITCIDHGPDIALGPRFEVVWQLLSVTHADRFRVAVRVGEDDPKVPTCTNLWPGASFSERECFDMFGIEFEGHPDLRRLLMPEGYGHHPLRKDFPHQGIQPDRLYREWDRERRKEWESQA